MSSFPQPPNPASVMHIGGTCHNPSSSAAASPSRTIRMSPPALGIWRALHFRRLIAQSRLLLVLAVVGKPAASDGRVDGVLNGQIVPFKSGDGLKFLSQSDQICHNVLNFCSR
mmetsp:Transcript_22323/g.37947  ORF Transcript_22323/g.37947 Transcript_22323/m.37947 type:complete len:113 (-) Transcript_22323:409-747(-)